jgi:hypothetical protein
MMGIRRIALGLLVAIPLAVAALGNGTAATGVADWATPVGALPAKVDGSTKSAHVRKEAPVPSCSSGQGVVWYAATAPGRGPMLATVDAGGDSDAALVVYRIVRSKTKELLCVPTDRAGRASVPWYGNPGQSYLIGVARRAGSPAGPFRLSVAFREPLPHPPGTALPAAGTSDAVTPVLDAADAWAVPMQRGTSYKINLASPRACVGLDVYRPGSYRFDEASHAERGRLSCGGYLLFTPGVDGGGTYSLVVKAAGAKPAPQPYRLMVAQAGADDTAPGVALTSGQAVAGSLDSRALDVSDLYSFTVPRNGSLTTIDFRPGPKLRYDLLVLDETGGRVTGVRRAYGKQSLEEKIPSGRYFLSLRALHQSGGPYRLSVLTREVTSTTIAVNGARFVETSPGASVSLQVYVAAASHGGVVELEIDRFDPIFGWQFSTMHTGAVDLGGRFTTSWTPPWAGHWRAIARFPGNVYSTPSKSDYARVHVAAPLEE